MGEVVQFVPKPGLERVRLIREARAIYERIFPSEDPAWRPRAVFMTSESRKETQR
jgi:hypothetical protein